jgi:hypothetical protein
MNRMRIIFTVRGKRFTVDIDRCHDIAVAIQRRSAATNSAEQF